MNQTTYSSVPVTENSSLAEKTWQEFRPFLNRYQWAPVDPSHSYRTEQIVKAITHRGQPGNCTTYRDGKKFVLKPLRDWVFKRAIERGQKLYYVSFGDYALPYLDVDLHQAWQTPEEGEKAKQIIDRLLGPHVFWSESDRGKNGYLKVTLCACSYEYANQVFCRLENAIRLVLAKLKNLADFEVKGKIGYMRQGKYQGQQYGKLPIHRNWTFGRLEEFRKTPFISVRRLEALCERIERMIPAEALQRHNAYKKSFGDQLIIHDGYFLVPRKMEEALNDKYGEFWPFSLYYRGEDGCWLHLQYYREGQLPMTEREFRELELQKEEDDSDIAQPVCIGVNLRRTGELGTGRQPTENRSAETRTEVNRVDPRCSGPSGRYGAVAGERSGQQSHEPDRYVGSRRHFFNIDLSDLVHEPDSFKRQKEALFRFARYSRSRSDLDGSVGVLERQEPVHRGLER